MLGWYHSIFLILFGIDGKILEAKREIKLL